MGLGLGLGLRLGAGAGRDLELGLGGGAVVVRAEGLKLLVVVELVVRRHWWQVALWSGRARCELDVSSGRTMRSRGGLGGEGGAPLVCLEQPWPGAVRAS